MKLCIYLVVLLFSSLNANGQKLLFHKNRYREAYYNIGDVISFQLKGDKTKFSGKICAFEEGLIVFEDGKVNPADITYLYVDAKTKLWFITRYKYQGVLPIAGLTIFSVDVLNERNLRKETLILSGALIATGFLAKFVVSKKFKIKGHRRLVVI